MARNTSGLKRGNPATQFQKGTEKQRQIARMGGLKRAENARKRKNFEEVLLQIANMQVPFEDAIATLKKHGVKEDDRDYLTLITLQSAIAAANGSYNHAEFFINNYVKAMEKAEIAEESKFHIPAELLGRDFIDINREIRPNVSYVFKGGRGSLKSTFISEKIVELLINNPNMHACCIRKVGKTLKDSVWSQIRWSIDQMGLSDKFEVKKSPLEIIYKKTGQTIFFRGLDDPVKLKSTKPVFGYIGILWLEEADQIAGMAEVRSTRQSLLRGGDSSYEFISYNPPRSRSAWVNEEELVEDPNKVVHTSNFQNVPKHWLGKKFLDDAAHLKETNEAAYLNEYMGIANGSGGAIFENLTEREITDEEIKNFKALYAGVDWGYYPDAYHFVMTSYNRATGTIYIFDEHRCYKTPNSETAKWILDKYGERLKDAPYGVICDSAEQKSILDYQMMKVKALPCKKFAGSVDFGIKWLQFQNIVIDKKRCPHTYNELVKYEYPRDKDGNIVSGYVDKDNHAIDALRYAYCLLYMTEMPKGKYYMDGRPK